jgi:hypothetical protein
MEMQEVEAEAEERGPLIPTRVLGVTAIICAAVLVTITVLGPVGLGQIQYRISQSGLYQTEGFDITDAVLLAPILVLGGVLALTKRGSAKYFLILPPMTLFYTGLAFGTGQEYSNPAMLGNVQNYFGLYLALMIGGIILLLGAITSFEPKDAPRLNLRGLRIYVLVMSIFLLVFAGMWVSQIMQVISTGNLSDGSYAASPTAFWSVKYLDLGLTIPVGIIAMMLLLSKPRSAYPLVLTFFGFFVTLGTAVNAMAIVEVLDKDPALASSAAGLVVFPVLGVLAWGGFLYLVRDKLHGVLSRKVSVGVGLK